MKTDPAALPGLSTLCIHGGEARDAQGALTVPLYNHTTFGFESTQALLDVINGRAPGNLYTRYGMNPTIRAVEAKLALIEGAEATLLMGSGMAAESATLLGLCQAGDHIVCVGDVYGGTYALMAEQLPRLGINTTFLMGDERARVAQALQANTRVVYFETPSNPNLDVLDIAAIAAAAKAGGALTVVDNTFASPVNQLPLQWGADVVVQSATKFLGGHSDLTGGVIAARQALIDRIAPWRKNLGQIMAPDVAFLLARSLRTLTVRVRQQNANAQQIAEFLSAHAKVLKVNYPGLASSPTHAIAAKQMRGFGGMVSFVFDGDAVQTSAMVDRLRLIALAPSLGGVESLATQPVTTTHHDMAVKERLKRGIVDGLVRLSIGLEDVDDLIADLQQALA
ncbi:PLP-dependent aspartate aminotransferase family protein [Sinimarinibacterium sp. NLF-5-8]|uniref:trans-sulfuration enzyme family protein n=1 Tax=Sinimarinibacterium sp. NLF-5-8 TaxID=2698684 RepID=UPI00137C2599|nr:aminotransferase class I/II-fold pyridoxal phosphate-dependent enzyme [Sinimarinibacterium sp. NLF-5-8]QHS10972.1 aminotransferase class I/II-fold pyridoxal phosphate-dependent enzyme [Sinimarinibacterium sp. NLF-5-8]